jgi:hypothetical protein
MIPVATKTVARIVAEIIRIFLLTSELSVKEFY